MSGNNEEMYVEQLIHHQSKLLAYIYSLTGDYDQTHDIFQETNRKLWLLRDDYDSTRPFLPWACTIAFNHVRTARKKLKRDRLLFHDDETLKVLSDAQSCRLERLNDRALALETCLGNLANEQRELLSRYYGDSTPITKLAETLGRTANAVSVSLHRIRQALADCIRSTI